MSIPSVRFGTTYYARAKTPEEIEKMKQRISKIRREEGGGIFLQSRFASGEVISAGFDHQEYRFFMWAMGGTAAYQWSIDAFRQYAATPEGDQHLRRSIAALINFIQIAKKPVIDLLTGKPYVEKEAPQSSISPAIPDSDETSDDAETETPPDDKKLDAFRDFINSLDLDDFGKKQDGSSGT